MKIFRLFLLSMLVSVQGFGQQKPETFFYQTRITDDNGMPVVSRNVELRLTILAGNPSGPVVFSEHQQARTDKEGFAALTVGNGSDKLSTLSSIDWNANVYFLKVEADPSGNSSFREISTTELLNIPFEAQKKSSRRFGEIVIEDEFVMTRRYVGQYQDYRHTGTESSSGPNLIWIKTSQDKTFGKLSAYGKTCDFRQGDRLYVRRIFFSPGDITGYWIYQIENDSSVFYRLSEFQYDKKVYVETLFNH